MSAAPSRAPSVVATDRANLDAQRQHAEQRDRRTAKMKKFRKAWTSASARSTEAWSELRAARVRFDALDEAEKKANRAYHGIKIVHAARPGDVFRVVTQIAEYWVAFQNETAEAWSGYVYHEHNGKWAKTLTSFPYGSIDRATGENIRTRRTGAGGLNESPALFVGDGGAA